MNKWNHRAALGPFRGRFVGLVLWDVACTGSNFSGQVGGVSASGPSFGTFLWSSSFGTIFAPWVPTNRSPKFANYV